MQFYPNKTRLRSIETQRYWVRATFVALPHQGPAFLQGFVRIKLHPRFALNKFQITNCNATWVWVTPSCCRCSSGVFRLGGLWWEYYELYSTCRICPYGETANLNL